ncbi:MAG TPA: tryptophan synthase subunit alpha [Sumerlaeia bacterium]|nr:tryptophan synthase subunit alpha [Sumerlaeia bacterium]
MNRIEEHFARARVENRKSLILFLTAGFPDLDTTEKIIETVAASGCDVLELGVPFSDPIADGPTIQASSTAALAAGTTLAKILDLVERLRKRCDIPILLFGAYNPFLRYGLEDLVERARRIGIDGFLVPDLPIEESADFEALCRTAGLSLVYLVAPTTPPERMRRIAERSTGFLYFISMKGVTGGLLKVTDELREQMRTLREAAGDLPVAIGFGISTPKDVAELSTICDVVVVGSALIRLIGRCKDSPDLLDEIAKYVGSLKAALS